jgi:hypothetical protein
MSRPKRAVIDPDDPKGSILRIADEMERIALKAWGEALKVTSDGTPLYGLCCETLYELNGCPLFFKTCREAEAFGRGMNIPYEIGTFDYWTVEELYSLRSRPALGMCQFYRRVS